MIRALAKHLPHPLLMRMHQRYQLAHQSALAHEISSRTGLPLLESLDLSRLKISDTVFILGSGLSVNEISDLKWEVISHHDSIALNFWPVHPFVPTIYLFENVRPLDDLQVMFDALKGLLERRASDYQHTVKVVSEFVPLNHRQLVLEIPEAFREHLYIGYSANIVARNEEELVAGLRYMIKRGMFQHRDHIRWQFKSGGSVLAALSMAVSMGYRRIVLCGIDLKNAEYFYQDPRRYPEASQWEFVPRNSLHMAARRLQWLVPAQEVIVHFKREVLDTAQIELFVENRSSALFPRVAELSWEALPRFAQTISGEVPRRNQG
jgi:hypothetical protein